MRSWADLVLFPVISPHAKKGVIDREVGEFVDVP
jgi:hypothetical protein